MHTPIPIDRDERARLEDALSSLPFDVPLVARPDASLDPRHDDGWSFGKGMLVGAVLLAFAFGAVVVPRLVASPPTPTPSTATPATMEEAFLLRCLAPDEAAALLRPLIRDDVSSIVISPRAPRVITVRATPERMQRVRATIHRYEEGDATACARPASPAPQ